MNFQEELLLYQPFNEQEAKDKEIMLSAIQCFGPTILTRSCELGHMTASSMILNESRTKVLMVYHNIFQSWGWTGGHADHQADLLQVALREAREETGVRQLGLLKEGLWAIDLLPVWGHFKRGKYVSSHMHLNYTYLFEAQEDQPLRIKEDENSGVMWIELDEMDRFVREPEMLPVYHKLLREYETRK